MVIVLEDESGRRVDLHALRATLGTRLARQGVAPAITQRVMRHADNRTTQKRYQDISLTDTASAIADLPGGEDEDAPEPASDEPQALQQFCQQREHDNVRSGAMEDDEGEPRAGIVEERKPSDSNALCREVPNPAKLSRTYAGVTQW